MSRIIAALLLILLPVTAQAQEAHQSETVGQTTDEEAVWALEHDYWRYAEIADNEAYLALWDDSFVGWPGGSELPTGKSNIDSWIGELHADPTRRIKFWIKPMASAQFGDVVVVHYRYGGNWFDVETGEAVESFGEGRITHTWQRRGNSWQIITGMSAG
ncbi:MAG: nuclear transport factor 2 family protein [Pontixanthobacter sp.]